jgi:hypothetical protein
MTIGPVYLRSPGLPLGVGSYFVLVGTSERMPTRTTGHVRCGTIRESSVERRWCVDRVFPCRVYIDSNRRDSCI